MTKKTFTLRVDLESDKGIKKGLPKLLDLLKKKNIKASFYICMGGESGLVDLLRYSKKMKSSGERKLKVFSLAEKLRIAFLPRDFVLENKKILKRILDEGHELGIHGWKHREWTRGLNKIDVRNRIQKSMQKYKNIFGVEAKSFAAPGFNTNEKVMKILEKYGIKFVSDFEGDSVKTLGKIKNVPMTILGKNRMPVIEYLVSVGKSDSEIIEIIKKECEKKRLASFYIHDLFEARFKRELLERIFEFVRERKFENRRIIDY